MKKKKSGDDNGKVQYTLTDWDEEGDPNQLNVYEYNDDGSLKAVVSYDISGMNASKWISAGKEMDGEDGEIFFAGTEMVGEEDLEDSMILQKAVYGGDRGDEVIEYVLSDYDDEGKPNTVSLYEYHKDGDSDDGLDEVVTYDLTGEDIDLTSDGWMDDLEDDQITKTTVYEGKKGEEKVVYALEDYEENEEGLYQPTQMSVYGYDTDNDGKELKEIRKYDISGIVGTDSWDTSRDELLSGNEETLANYIDALVSETIFTGAEGEERVDQVLYYTEGQIVERQDFEYRTYSAKYAKNDKYAISSTITYSTEDLDADTARERGAGLLQEEAVFAGPQGKEKTQQIYYYDDLGDVVERKDYSYDGNKLIATTTMDTEGLSFDEARTAGAGELIEESTFEGNAGKEKLTNTFYYTDGEMIERRDYEYDGDKLTNTYLYDIDGISGSDARISGSGTLMEESIFSGKSGKEKILQTLYFGEDGDITARRDYEYSGNRLIATCKYDTSGLDDDAARTYGRGLVDEESIYSGIAGKEKIQKTTTYAWGENGERVVENEVDFYYENGILKYSTQTDPTDPLDLFTTYFKGRKGRERIDWIDNPIFTGISDPVDILISDPRYLDGTWDVDTDGNDILITYQSDDVEDFVYTFHHDGDGKLLNVERESYENYQGEGPHNQVDIIYYDGEDGMERMDSVHFYAGLVSSYSYSAMGVLESVTQTNIEGDIKVTMTYEGAKGKERVKESTDYRGITTTYHYDDETDGRLISLSKSNGANIYYSGEKGSEKVEWTIDSNGIKNIYHYDTEHNAVLERVVSETSEGIFLSESVYDGDEGREKVVSVTDRKNKVTLFEYENGRLIATSSSDGSSAVYTQNLWGEDQLVTTTDKKGVTTTYQYGNLQGVKNVLVGASQDKNGNHIADIAYKLLNGEEVIDIITDRKGKVTTYEYEENDLIATSSSDGSSAVYAQNAWGEDQIVTTTDKKGVVTTYIYDADGYMASASQDKGDHHVADITYKLLNGEEVIDSITDRKGKVTTYEYEGNNLIATSSSDGSSAVYTQNAWGEDQLITTTDKKSIVTTYAYDADGYMASASQDKDGNHIASILYKLLNGEEVIDTITDRKDKVTTYEYDENNLVSTSSSDGSSAVYTQNEWGEDQLITTTDKKDVVTTYAYDTDGYMTSASQDKGDYHIADIAYKLLSGEEVIDTITDRKGKVTTYEYDGNNLASTSSSDGSSAVYTQNEWGEDQLVTTTDKKGVVTTYAYDTDGYMTSASQDKGDYHIADIAYKLLSGEEVIDTITDRKGKVTTYEYDGNNLASTSSSDGSSAVYTQNAWGEDQLVTTTDKKGVVTTYAYDADGYMASASQDKNGNHIANILYKLLNGEEVIDTITDRRGKVTTYAYNTDGNLLSTSTSDGSNAVYTQNAWGEDQLVTTTDKKSVVTTYAYDADGYMASASQDKNGNHIASILYKLLNGEEVIDTITDRKDKVTTYEYSGNNLIATSSSDGSSAVYTQNAWGEDQLITTTDKKGVVTTYAYDADGYMASASQDKDGNHIASILYKLLNGEEVIDTITDRKDKVTTYEYDENNLVSTSSSDGSSAVYTQNEWGEDQLITTTDKKDVVTTYAYDTDGYMTSASQDKGDYHIADIAYKLLSGEEVIDTITDRKGKVTTYEYDGNNLASTSSSDGSSAVYTQNEWGEDQLVTTTDKKGVVTTYAYDTDGYMTSASQDKGDYHIADIAYKLLSGEEVIDTITDRKGKVTTYEYDGNNLASTSSSDGSSAVYTQNAWGEDQLVTTTDKKGVVTTYAYDADGYMASASQDKNGNHIANILYKLLNGEEVIDTITDRRGKVTTYAYNTDGNLLSTSTSDGSNAVYTQNAWGEDQLVTTTDKKSVVTTYAYDADGYMASASQDKNGNHIASILYKLLNGEEVIDTITDRKDKVTTYEYSGNNLIATSSSDGSSAVYTQNAWGEDQLITTTDKKGVVTTYAYDTDGYMASASQDKDGNHIASILYKLLNGEEVIDTITDRKDKVTTYAYDTDGNLLSTSTSDGSSAVYTQNAWGEDQLVTTTDKKGVVTTYAYDTYGYMASASQDKDGNHIASILYKLLNGEEVIDTITDRKDKVTTYAYDTDGNLLSTSTSDGSNAVYTQNAWGEDQLVTTTDKKGVVTTYAYDTDGYMINASQSKDNHLISDIVYTLLNGEEVIDTITDRKGKVTTYEYSGNNLIATSSSDGSSAIYTQNEWGEDQIVTTTDKKGVVTTYAYDADGYMASASQDKDGNHIASILYKLLSGEEVIDTITDRKDKVTTYAYDTDGNLLSTSTSDGSNAVYTQNAWGEDQIVTTTDKKGVVTTYAYDADGYMASASQDKGDYHIADILYKLLNGEEVIDTITDRKGKVTTYEYEGNNLIATSSSDGSSAVYTQNAWGEDQIVTTTDKKG
ncbi:MAG: WD40 repeat domain-containing protein, partial [Candidatus Omnitrophica bacterium]|nr:WD40 repeat domain-containing protein [Candidatus Omnitrophota bacterium]